MRRLAVTLLTVASTLFLGCGDSSQVPTEAPEPAPGGAPESQGDLQKQADELFRGAPAHGQINKQLAQVVCIRVRKSPAAQAVIFQIIDQTLKSFYAGKLPGGTSPATQAKVFEFITALQKCAGIATTLPPGALSDDGAVAVIPKNNPADITVRTGTGFAAVRIFAGTSPETFILSISRIPDNSPPLNTSLEQRPLFYLYQPSVPVQFTSAVLVAICQTDHDDPFSSLLRLAHNVGNGIEVLPLAAPADLVDCDDVSPAEGGASSAGPGGFAGYGFAALTRAILPMPLHATAVVKHAGLGGTTRTFSPFGAVVTAPPLPIAYSSGGYRYLVGSQGHTPGFESPAFVEGEEWATGAAAFGSGSVTEQSCPLDATVQTDWDLNTDLLVRKQFQLDAVPATGVQIRVAIDNDVQIFVNGTEISDGFAMHEGCATLDSFIFTAPSELLQTGTNLLAIRARDDGVISFLDVRVEVAPIGGPS